jgi:hypothetical protein
MSSRHISRVLDEVCGCVECTRNNGCSVIKHIEAATPRWTHDGSAVKTAIIKVKALRDFCVKKATAHEDFLKSRESAADPEQCRFSTERIEHWNRLRLKAVTKLRDLETPATAMAINLGTTVILSTIATEKKSPAFGALSRRKI